MSALQMGMTTFLRPLRAAALGAAVLIFAAGCSNADTLTPTTPTTMSSTAATTPPDTVIPVAPSVQTGHMVEYTIAGGANDASTVTYSTQAGTAQTMKQPLPWVQVTRFEGRAAAVIMAQNTLDGTITCAIRVDGVEVARNQSDGMYAVVQCSATFG